MILSRILTPRSKIHVAFFHGSAGSKYCYHSRQWSRNPPSETRLQPYGENSRSRALTILMSTPIIICYIQLVDPPSPGSDIDIFGPSPSYKIRASIRGSTVHSFFSSSPYPLSLNGVVPRPPSTDVVLARLVVVIGSASALHVCVQKPNLPSRMGN